MLPQVIVRSVGNPFKLLPVAAAKRKSVFDIDASLCVMRKLISIMLPELYPPGQQAIVGYQSFQHGGIVQRTGPAWVEKGEVIIPNIATSPAVNIYLDGEKVGEIISRQQGNQYAQRVEMGG